MRSTSTDEPIVAHEGNQENGDRRVERTRRRPIRIMQYLWGLGMGGMEKTLINVCNRLPRDEFDVCMAIFDPGGPMESRLDQNLTELIEIKKGFGNDPMVPLRLAREIKKRKIDILHTNMWGTLLEGAVAAKLASVPVVIHEEHGTVPDKFRHVIAQRWGWGRADRVVSVSAALADRMHEIVGYPREKIQVINNSVDTEKFRPLGLDKTTLRDEFSLPHDKFIFVMLSRFVPFKNHSGVIDAIHHLKGRGIEVHLALVGDGPLASDLRNQVRELAIMDRVHFVGETSKVERVLNACDGFVSNSSHNEGLSLALLEGMASGLPVIATDVAAHAEVLDGGKAGVLIRPACPDSLADALFKICSDKSLSSQLSISGATRAKSEFGVESMVESYASLYRELVASIA